MDYTAIVMGVVSFVLGIVGISAFMSKNMPKVEPWVALSKDAVETLDDLAKALQPDPTTGKVELTPEEIARLTADAEGFKVQFALCLGKK